MMVGQSMLGALSGSEIRSRVYPHFTNISCIPIVIVSRGNKNNNSGSQADLEGIKTITAKMKQLVQKCIPRDTQSDHSEDWWIHFFASKKCILDRDTKCSLNPVTDLRIIESFNSMSTSMSTSMPCPSMYI